jgi:hypothetical protein
MFKAVTLPFFGGTGQQLQTGIDILFENSHYKIAKKLYFFGIQLVPFYHMVS